MEVEFQGEFANEHPLWDQRLATLYRQITEVKLIILVWGPGPRSESYDKRKQICDHLNRNPHNDAVTSETLIKEDKRFKDVVPHPYDAEQLQVYAADVIFVLVVRQARGSQHEIGIFWHNSDFQKKAYLIAPYLSDEERQEQQQNAELLAQGWINYPGMQQLPYTPEEYDECSKIREFCEEVVKNLRRQRGMEQLRTSQRVW